MSITVERVNERVKILDAVLEGQQMSMVLLEGRLKALELDVDNYDPTTDKASHVAHLHRRLITCEHDLMEALMRVISKRLSDEGEGDGSRLRALPEITDRTSRLHYISLVTNRLAAKQYTAQEAKTLLYAAQLHMQGDGSKANPAPAQ